MSHPETAQLPAVHKPRSEVQQPGSSNRKNNLPKPEEKTSEWKKKPPKVEEKASTSGSKNKAGRKFNGEGGRIHTEAQIDRILDEYILTGKLPSYVSERQRYDYRHHVRLAERRKLLDKSQTGNKASGTSTTAGSQDNITRFPGTGTHGS